MRRARATVKTLERPSLLPWLLAAGLLAASATARGEEAAWPCRDEAPAAFTAEQVWKGPALSPTDPAKSDAALMATVSKITDPAATEQEAQQAIDAYAATLGEDRNARLSMLFHAVLESANRERSTLISGIQRYAKRQKALLAGLEERAQQIKALPSDQMSARTDLEEQQSWNQRIFDERERSLRYICEEPGRIGERLAAVAGHIQQQMK